MKKFMNPLSMLVGILSMFLITSCDSDDPVVIDPGGDGINVADGYYFAKSGADPVSSAALSSETVEDDGFTSQARSGFLGGYIFLDAGDYNIVQITDKELTMTLGGSATTESDMSSDCDFNDYTVVSTSVGGGAFTVPSTGLWRVTYDGMTNESILYEINSPGLIGDATPNGWGGDTPLTGSVDATGGSWQATGLVLRAGQWKVRFNCRWNLDRRADPNAGFMAANGYQFFTNYGGSVGNLQNGNDAPNIEQAEDGEYTVDVTWSPQNGWNVATTRTGDAPVLTFNPNDFKFGIIGSATAGSWDSDRDMLYKDNGGVPTWYGVVTLLGGVDDKIKFRTNDSWDFNIGGVLTADGTAQTVEQNGPDIASPGAGAYYITISTADEGTTWTATMTSNGWGIIGQGGPTMGWDDDMDMTPDGFMDGVTTYSLTGDFTTDAWKFRAGDDWALNLGDNLSPLILDGGDLTVAEAGSYKVTLSFDGSTYSATAEKQ